MNRWIAVVCIALGLSLVAYGLLGRQTDEDEIRASLHRLEEAIRVDADTSPSLLFRMAHLQREFAEIFEKNAVCRIPERNLHAADRKALAELAQRSTASLTTFTVEFSGVEIRLAAGGALANVESIAHVRAFAGNERHEEGVRHVRFEFARGNDGWRVSSVRVDPQEDAAIGSE